MAENGYDLGPVAGHHGRIPNYGKQQQNQPIPEPPACIQNAMMTKDKKPFTYTPGGLDLTHIKTPSMARRLNRQRSDEEQQQQLYQQSLGMSVPPPPPPPCAQSAPPPPPLVIQAPRSPKPTPQGERPEIVIPENPIGMLRKTNSPYHWESERAERERQGAKFIDKEPSPTFKQNAPATFTQQPPQSFQQNYDTPKVPESPVHRPEPKYVHKPVNPPQSPPTQPRCQDNQQYERRQETPFERNTITPSQNIQKSPSPYENIQRQYQPSPAQNSFQSVPQNSPFERQQFQSSPSVSSSPWRQTQESPKVQDTQISPNPYENKQNFQSPPTINQSPWRQESPKVQDTQKSPNPYENRQNFQSPPTISQSPWRQESPRAQETQIPIQRATPQPNQYTNQVSEPQYRSFQNQNNQTPQFNTLPRSANQAYVTSNWQGNSGNGKPTDLNNNYQQNISNSRGYQTSEPTYQTKITIPVTPRNPPPEPPKRKDDREIVYVNQEPVYYCPPNCVPIFIKQRKEKTPPPEWCQIADQRRFVPNEPQPQRGRSVDPEWVFKSQEVRKNAIRELMSPPPVQQSTFQPVWSTKPSENRKSVANNETQNNHVSYQPNIHHQQENNGQNQHEEYRIPVQTSVQHNGACFYPSAFQNNNDKVRGVYSPHAVKIEQISKSNNQTQTQNTTRIIPIQFESSTSGSRGPRVFYNTTIEPPRQSKSFRVLQIITGTNEHENYVDYSDF